MPILMGNRFIKIAILIIISVLFIKCNKRSFDDDIMMLSYIKDHSNGFQKAETSNEFIYELIYKPTDLIISQEIESDFSKSGIDSLRNKYSKYLYFNLSISKDNREVLSKAPKNRVEFSKLSNQLLFGMKDKIHVYTQDMDTINMIDYIYPRMYGASHSTNMLFIYPRDDNFENSKSLNFVIKDIGLGTGDIKFEFETKKIINQPTISFKH